MLRRRAYADRSNFAVSALDLVLVLVMAAGAGSAWAQCPPGATSIAADRDNTLYQDGTGSLSNGAGDYFFAGITGNGDITRGLIHFDVASSLGAGLTVTHALLQLTQGQPIDHGTFDIGLHLVEADWGEEVSQAGMGEGGGATAMTDDATWLHTFHSSATWTTPGGDFDATASASTPVDTGGGTYTWSSPKMAADVQSWYDTPATNYGWLIQGNEGGGTTAARFASRTNSGVEPVLCVTTCGGAGPSCEVFSDGFESGDDSAWSISVP